MAIDGKDVKVITKTYKIKEPQKDTSKNNDTNNNGAFEYLNYD